MNLIYVTRWNKLILVKSRVCLSKIWTSLFALTLTNRGPFLRWSLGVGCLVCVALDLDPWTSSCVAWTSYIACSAAAEAMHISDIPAAPFDGVHLLRQLQHQLVLGDNEFSSSEKFGEEVGAVAESCHLHNLNDVSIHQLLYPGLP